MFVYVYINMYVSVHIFEEGLFLLVYYVWLYNKLVGPVLWVSGVGGGQVDRTTYNTSMFKLYISCYTFEN